MKATAIVPAAGRGLRMGINFSKPYILLSGTPILVHTLRTLSASGSIDKIIVVVNKSFIKKTKGLIRKYGLKKITSVLAGGQTRTKSVYNGLRAVDKESRLILVHDGVRPFLTKELIKKTVGCAAKFGACVCGMPVTPTIKQTGKRNFIKKTINRTNLWEIQTPQVFKKELLQRAYNKFRNTDATDDSMLVEKLGVKVKIIAGLRKNIKITTPQDLTIAEAIYRKG